MIIYSFLLKICQTQIEVFPWLSDTKIKNRIRSTKNFGNVGRGVDFRALASTFLSVFLNLLNIEKDQPLRWSFFAPNSNQ